MLTKAGAKLRPHRFFFGLQKLRKAQHARDLHVGVLGEEAVDLGDDFRARLAQGPGRRRSWQDQRPRRPGCANVFAADGTTKAGTRARRILRVGE